MISVTNKLQRIRALFLLVMVGVFLAIFYHGLLSYIGYGFPRNTFLFSPGDRFNDWHNSVIATQSLNPYFSNSPAVSTYFPFSYWLLSFFTSNGRDVNTFFYIIISIGLLTASTFYAWRFLFPEKPVGSDANTKAYLKLFGIFLICYPTIFALDRGNMDIWIGCLCLLYVVLFKTNHSLIGYTCLSIAIMLKGYPAAFLLLGLAEKKYLQTFLCFAISVSISSLIMLFFWGGFSTNLHGLQINLPNFYDNYVVGPHSLFGSSDPYNGIRTFVLIFNEQLSILPKGAGIEAWSKLLLKIYSPVSFVTACIAACFILFSNGRCWAKTTSVSLIILLFPNVANDYKLCILFAAVITILASNHLYQKTEKIAFVIIGLLLIPKSYILINGHNFSNIINPMLLISLSCITFLNPSQWRGLRKKEGLFNLRAS
jgi:hypothetical protein